MFCKQKAGLKYHAAADGNLHQLYRLPAHTFRLSHNHPSSSSTMYGISKPQRPRLIIPIKRQANFRLSEALPSPNGSVKSHRLPLTAFNPPPVPAMPLFAEDGQQMVKIKNMSNYELQPMKTLEQAEMKVQPLGLPRKRKDSSDSKISIERPAKTLRSSPPRVVSASFAMYDPDNVPRLPQIDARPSRWRKFMPWKVHHEGDNSIVSTADDQIEQKAGRLWVGFCVGLGLIGITFLISGAIILAKK